MNNTVNDILIIMDNLIDAQKTLMDESGYTDIHKFDNEPYTEREAVATMQALLLVKDQIGKAIERNK